jgi:hypothetical protein
VRAQPENVHFRLRSHIHLSLEDRGGGECRRRPDLCLRNALGAVVKRRKKALLLRRGKRMQRRCSRD